MDRETLEREVVAALVAAKLSDLLGEDIPREMEDLATVRAKCRKTLMRFVDDHAATVKAWCFREKLDFGVWGNGGLELIKVVDQSGQLDFSPIEVGAEISTLARAGLWPSAMKQTVDLAELGMDVDDLLGEKRRATEQREEEARRRRTISFAGNDLDTAAADFAERIVAIAEAGMLDNEWLNRSRKRFSLAEMPKYEPSRPGGGGLGGSRRRKDRISEGTKEAMGFASEYFASRFLAEKHKKRYDDSCWVSKNREEMLTDGEGFDGFGFDFRVRTVETEWRYEVKSSLDDNFEFEFTQNEMRVAAECASDGSRKYRILYVPYVFDLQRWRIMELPNPMSEQGRRLFRAIGAGSTRFRFSPS
eukprot:TRINITY_DN7282_c0_g1_i1.p2 TRINITY_DN7282_c0_g1~~TRINITY_DN7282_c0_g1_i1.p2  ORF type:complete len:374 (-),score=57.70 TRINITY_DN7282_c0_g1_i1:2212-3294(-)